ncbi:MAG: Sir2 silent information regulator family NAD-dependent deacetylase [Firmicutes bacterium]|nr:Sir2 silent information regulator family NAD-dependent deacetylase [Bacillota bacterium]
MKYTNNIFQQINKLKRVLETSDAIVIGAGAGFSASAGLIYSGERFQKNFADFIKKYGLKDMYSSVFYPYKSVEEFWAYMSRHIMLNRYEAIEAKPYHDLLDIVKNKEYFVISTNADHCFSRTGFSKQRLFCTQGNYGLWQCSIPCHKKTYNNKKIVLRMVAEQKECFIPSILVPYCLQCNSPMVMNLRIDGAFVQDQDWFEAQACYTDFVSKYSKISVLYLELGVGYNTPSIIKYPFWQYTLKNKKAIYACINLDDAYAPEEIASQSICIDADIGEVLAFIKKSG